MTRTPNCQQPGADPEAWWPAKPGLSMAQTQHEATGLCAGCPAIAACARLALDTESAGGGIWAGVYLPPGWATHAHRRDAFTRLKAIAAPPKRAPVSRRPPAGGRPICNLGRCTNPDCGISTVGKKDHPPTGMRRYGGHGLCEACYARQRRARHRHHAVKEAV